jgi:3-hydroxyisobutyrate dehydrogenase-like beta-hydroxyacid dehydrogenase
VLVDSPIGVTARSKRAHVESGSYPPRFKLALAVKDLQLVEEAAHATGVELRLARAALGWFEEAVQGGAGELDYSAVVRRIREAGGVSRGRAS